jgi:hypothetical protein
MAFFSRDGKIFHKLMRGDSTLHSACQAAINGRFRKGRPLLNAAIDD